MTQELLLPAFYLPNISYFKLIKDHQGPLVLEQFEHFPKQSYRTRTKIATANGSLDLIIPIVHGKKDRVAMKDIRINYDHPWQRLHWLSIQTAYRSSAYFEFYEDYFRPFYEQEFPFLINFHVEQLQLLLKLLKLDREINLSSSYQTGIPDSIDYRQVIHPKKEPLFPDTKPYYQLFEDKHGFIPDLSMLDLLVSQGPQAKNYF